MPSQKNKKIKQAKTFLGAHPLMWSCGLLSFSLGVLFITGIVIFRPHFSFFVTELSVWLESKTKPKLSLLNHKKNTRFNETYDADNINFEFYQSLPNMNMQDVIMNETKHTSEKNSSKKLNKHFQTMIQSNELEKDLSQHLNKIQYLKNER